MKKNNNRLTITIFYTSHTSSVDIRERERESVSDGGKQQQLGYKTLICGRIPRGQKK